MMGLASLASVPGFEERAGTEARLGEYSLVPNSQECCESQIHNVHNKNVVISITDKSSYCCAVKSITIWLDCVPIPFSPLGLKTSCNLIHHMTSHPDLLWGRRRF